MTNCSTEAAGEECRNRHSCWSHRVHRNLLLVYISSPVVAVRTASSRCRAPLQRKEPGSWIQPHNFRAAADIGIAGPMRLWSRLKSEFPAVSVPADHISLVQLEVTVGRTRG
jgi:hypothetical protein